VKPAGWLALAVLAALVIAVASAVVRPLWLRARGLEGLDPVPYTPPPPTETPTPVPPSPTPATPWQEGMYQTTDPVTGKSYWMVPADVEETIKEHFQEAVNWLSPEEPIFDADLYASQAPTYDSGPMLEWNLARFEKWQQDQELYWCIVDPGEQILQVKNCTPDGTECLLGWVGRGIRLRAYNFVTQQEVEVADGGLAPDFLQIYRMRYDPADGRWKVYELVQEVILEEPTPTP